MTEIEMKAPLESSVALRTTCFTFWMKQCGGEKEGNGDRVKSYKPC